MPVSFKTHSCTREEPLRIFTKEQDSCTDDLLGVIARDDEIFVAAQVI